MCVLCGPHPVHSWNNKAGVLSELLAKEQEYILYFPVFITHEDGYNCVSLAQVSDYMRRCLLPKMKELLRCIKTL